MPTSRTDAASDGKCPHEVEALKLAAARKAQGKQAEDARAAILARVPIAEAGWEQVAPFMAAVRKDIAEEQLGGWAAFKGLGANTVIKRCPAWRHGKTQEQANLISQFETECRVAFDFLS